MTRGSDPCNCPARGVHRAGIGAQGGVTEILAARTPAGNAMQHFFAIWPESDQRIAGTNQQAMCVGKVVARFDLPFILSCLPSRAARKDQSPAAEAKKRCTP